MFIIALCNPGLKQEISFFVLKNNVSIFLIIKDKQILDVLQDLFFESDS